MPVLCLWCGGGVSRVCIQMFLFGCCLRKFLRVARSRGTLLWPGRWGGGNWSGRVVDRSPRLVPVYSKLTQITLFISGFLRDAQNASRHLTTARERLHAGSWSGGIEGDDSQ